MRKIGLLVVGLLLITCAMPVLAGTTPAGSGDPFDLYFDEFGHGTYYQNGGPAVSDPGVMMTDPQSTWTALAYILPEPVAIGDVRIWEDPTATILSDLLRFENIGPNGNGVMFYFSDYEPGDPDDNAPADVGLPPLWNVADNGGVFELGSEGQNFFNWFPGGNTYHGISDSPEPSTLLLLGAGFAGLGMLRKRS